MDSTDIYIYFPKKKMWIGHNRTLTDDYEKAESFISRKEAVTETMFVVSTGEPYAVLENIHSGFVP